MNRAPRLALTALLLLVLACGTLEAGLDGPPTAPADPAASAIAVLENQRVRLSTQVALLEAATAVSVPQPQPTPQDILGGGTITSGPFVFDLRLIRDVSFSQQPVATSLYSDLEGIGAWTYWYYTGSAPTGPVQTWYGTVPQVDVLLQEAYPSIQLGNGGGRTGGVLLPGGPYMPGKSQAGDRIRLVLKITAPSGEYGAMLSFNLREGQNGWEPINIAVDSLSAPGAPTPGAYAPDTEPVRAARPASFHELA